MDDGTRRLKAIEKGDAQADGRHFKDCGHFFATAAEGPSRATAFRDRAYAHAWIAAKPSRGDFSRIL